MFVFLKTTNMIKLFKNRNKSISNAFNNNPTNENPQGFFAKLKTGLKCTRQQLSDGLTNLFLNKSNIDTQLLQELENLLIKADLGIATTKKIMDTITAKMKLNNVESLNLVLMDKLKEILLPCMSTFTIDDQTSPFVILMVGVNGSGKTTTIGKLVKKFQADGKKVLLAAGDTFRAAAIEQLKVWGERNNVPVIAQQTGADSASVIFDAMQAAKARNYDILIADTAGRLHNKENLMSELEKIVRVLKKIDLTAPHQILLTIDACVGQNALTQAQKFHHDIGANGIILTKLDGTAKGGIIFAIADQMQLPIYFIGLGEGIDDLKPFDAEAFIEALFIKDETESEMI